jgi:hypothetical protein
MRLDTEKRHDAIEVAPAHHHAQHLPRQRCAGEVEREVVAVIEVLESLVADSPHLADVLGLCPNEFKTGCRGLRSGHGASPWG